jgi:cholesterol oxidase
MDDVATLDWPAAVRTVCSATGSRDVEVIAHCMGSMTLLMALLSGLQNVRFGICSAVGFYPMAPALTRLKAILRLPQVVKIFTGLMTTHYDGTLVDKLVDAALLFYPTNERCSSPVCRRIEGIYGNVFHHDNLNEATHEAIDEMFGVGNVTSFEHILKIFEVGRLVSHEGSDVYIPHVSSLKTPITFVHGEKSGMFNIEGTKRTFDELCQVNGPEHYRMITLPEYAHMDVFIGKNSAKDVFPLLVQELDKH